jgi:hypothetical protein
MEHGELANVSGASGMGRMIGVPFFVRFIFILLSAFSLLPSAFCLFHSLAVGAVAIVGLIRFLCRDE